MFNTYKDCILLEKRVCDLTEIEKYNILDKN